MIPHLGLFSLRCLRHSKQFTVKFKIPIVSSRWLSTRENWSTPLAKQLSEAITTTGPISLAAFMRMCLTSDLDGYYSSKQPTRDVFGKKGDFVTSPEISQIFGELIGIWFATEWMAQGRQRKGVQMIEIGPGMGTLMDDILRTIENFKAIKSSIDAIYLVEVSPSLREAQKKLLCGDAPMVEISIGYESLCKRMNIPVIWTDNLRFVPSSLDSVPFIVAHEFFDALPIHAFQPLLPSNPIKESIQTPTGNHRITSTAAKALQAPQWRELVVSPVSPDLENPSASVNNSSNGFADEFQLTISQKSTSQSNFLPEMSQRYRTLKSDANTVLEISPESLVYAQEIAKRIGGTSNSPRSSPSGAALILDYGPQDSVPQNSLRGIYRHERVSPFTRPGLVDLSADVDFAALAEAALAASPGIEIHGPVEQGFFLMAMGIRERAKMLSDGIPSHQIEKQKHVEIAWKRLVDQGENGMGRIYKAMAIVPENGGMRKPVGFGGDVA
ncbi:BgTH12-02427 [Blumeria graminis f. sp. triticale]|uniref:Protein arginine methyltransferase NDUFAF7 n=1 Tax=Blumeria graminis f. sp. triticale TaxID=1689686 RepID=A0A9W4D0Q0_BLUGR|nr:BgTH12-02427 [Blumeria graminis f. sp. triticale]